MSWNADASTGQYSDTLIARDTMEKAYDDFSGRAAIYESVSASKPFPVDLIVQSVDFSFGEHTQTEQHIGNGFSFIAFGKDAMVLSVHGALVDTGENYGKDSFMDIYRNYLRVEAVARRGVAPVFSFPNAAMYCAATAVNFAESSASQDLVYVTISLIVMKAVFRSGGENFMLDYVHGTEFSGDSVLTTTGTPDVTRSTSSPSIVSKSSSTSNSISSVIIPFK